jgi:hypothetical protein
VSSKAKVKTISFTPEVLKAKLLVLERRGTCMTRRAGKHGNRVAQFAVGDLLWARERAEVLALNEDDSEMRVRYALDGVEAVVEWPDRIVGAVVGRCIPNGVHREGARHFFEVVSVKAERVCDISEEDAVLEGCLSPLAAQHGRVYARTIFHWIWTTIYGPDAWNQWCWAYTLKRAET